MPHSADIIGGVLKAIYFHYVAMPHSAKKSRDFFDADCTGYAEFFCHWFTQIDTVIFYR